MPSSVGWRRISRPTKVAEPTSAGGSAAQIQMTCAAGDGEWPGHTSLYPGPLPGDQALHELGPYVPRNVRVQQRLLWRLSLDSDLSIPVLPLFPNRCDRGFQVVRNGALLPGSLFH
jgi:hypothetical protein